MRALVAGLALAAVLLVGCGADYPAADYPAVDTGRPVSSDTLAAARMAEYTTSDGTLCVVAVKDNTVALTCDWDGAQR